MSVALDGLASTTAVNVINTVEKMQGQERDLVIVCYAGFDFNEPSELDFVYQRERLNTGVSRAKKKCILLVDPKVLNPAIAVCETAERQAGYELLRRIKLSCEEGHPLHTDNGWIRLPRPANANAAPLDAAQPPFQPPRPPPQSLPTPS